MSANAVDQGATGTAGGVLSGTYPNPGMAAGAAATNLGPAGGGLTGTYPNPGLSAAAILAAEPWVWIPSDNSLLAASMDPASSGTTFVATAGTLLLARMNIRASLTITNLLISMTSAGVGASTGSFVGLYSSAGTLLSGSADIGTALTGATGVITTALTAAQAITGPAFVWAAFLCNLATTQPTLARAGVASASVIMGQSAAAFRFCTNGTGLTALPASITPASNSGSSNALLVGAT